MKKADIFLRPYWPTYAFIGLITLFVIALILFTVIVYLLNFSSALPPPGQRGDWGALGDFFGGILNPVLSFAGFLLLVVTVHQSNQALRISQEELRNSRDELARSTAALKDQASTLERQRFENTFFLLIEQLSNSINTVTDANYGAVIQGGPKVSILDAICLEINRTTLRSGSSVDSQLNQLQLLISDIRPELVRVFRIVYQTLKFLDDHSARINSDNQLDPQFEKENMIAEYVGMLRTFLPEGLQLVLAAYCLSKNLVKKVHFRDLINKHALLDSISYIPPVTQGYGKRLTEQDSEIISFVKGFYTLHE